MPLAHTNGVHLHYEVWGGGSPILFIPPEAMGAWAWFRQVPAIKRLAQVVVYDPRDVGGSHVHQFSSDHSIETMARDAVGLLQFLSIGRATVVGADAGGFVALQLALERPELVERLVLACTAGGGAPETFLTEDARRLRRETAGIDPIEQFRHEIGLMVATGFTNRNPGLLDTLVEHRRVAAVAQEVLDGQRAAAAAWQASLGAGPSMPVLAIGGRDDRFQQAGSLEAVVAGISGARIEWIPQCGHLPYIERPDMFNRLVMNFVFEGERAEGPDARGVGAGAPRAPVDWELRDGRSDFPAEKRAKLDVPLQDLRVRRPPSVGTGSE